MNFLYEAKLASKESRNNSLAFVKVVKEMYLEKNKKEESKQNNKLLNKVKNSSTDNNYGVNKVFHETYISLLESQLDKQEVFYGKKMKK
uniref:Uncharacterized protein n=1 Tax=Strongyloides papillosus TaxID=174720 RepID=A0A0N5C3M4_STREA